MSDRIIKENREQEIVKPSTTNKTSSRRIFIHALTDYIRQENAVTGLNRKAEACFRARLRRRVHSDIATSESLPGSDSSRDGYAECLTMFPQEGTE